MTYFGKKLAFDQKDLKGYINFLKSLLKGLASLNTGQARNLQIIRKILTELRSFFDIGIG